MVLEGTFQRKVNAKREAEKVKPPWVRVETKVTSRAMSERKPQVREPSPREKLKGWGPDTEVRLADVRSSYHDDSVVDNEEPPRGSLTVMKASLPSMHIGAFSV